MNNSFAQFGFTVTTLKPTRTNPTRTATPETTPFVVLSGVRQPGFGRFNALATKLMSLVDNNRVQVVNLPNALVPAIKTHVNAKSVVALFILNEGVDQNFGYKVAAKTDEKTNITKSYITSAGLSEAAGLTPEINGVYEVFQCKGFKMVDNTPQPISLTDSGVYNVFVPNPTTGDFDELENIEVSSLSTVLNVLDFKTTIAAKAKKVKSNADGTEDLIDLEGVEVDTDEDEDVDGDDVDSFLQSI
jgi:hypothetical protein